ncbi:pregnancy-specific glycoprotein 22-like [Mesocricetus auratus]|uniref:Pregnancy-specific glycoprotein 22-like n=1 Tax=Mesocricetus auratus TaxID=10036 RepID=A0ABM2WKQ4_MESAU|nr:pregnancy-specific glycoprotein 22-like [Mesocricetus auratus]
MEEPSMLLCKGCTPGPRLLLTVCLISFWPLPTTAQYSSETVPTLVAEGDNVLIPVHNLPKKIKSITWYKEIKNETKAIAIYELRKNSSQPGPAHTGRETIFYNGTLLFEKVNMNDRGFYTLRTHNRRGKIVSTTKKYLNVLPFLWKCGRLAAHPKTTVELVPPIVAEGRSVLLLIRNTPEAIIGYIWFKGTFDFKNLVAIHHVGKGEQTLWGPAYRGRHTVNSDGSLLIQHVTQKDGGFYILRVLRRDGDYEDVQVQLPVGASAFCNPLTSQIAIQPVPPYATEGQRVLLQVHNLPEDILAFYWYKANYRSSGLQIVENIKVTNSITWGPAHSQGWMVYNNGSLMLPHVTEEDAGVYMLEVVNKNVEFETAYVEFYIKKYVTQPIVQITDNTLTGGTSVIFICISPDTDVSIRWIFKKNNLQLKERMTLSPTKCGLRIDPVMSEDAGDYQCEVSNQFSLKTSLPVYWP